MNIVSFGTDSEFLVYEKETGKFIPAYRFIKGTKEEPQHIGSFLYGDLYVHWDNVALEVTATPLEFGGDIITPHAMSTYLSEVYQQVQSWMDSHCPELLLTFRPVVEIDEETMFEREANIFGCEPDYNVWTLQQNPSPSPMKAGKLRTAGAHLHFGLQPSSDDNIIALLKLLDKTAADLGSHLGRESLKKEYQRRSLYGMAGSFRRKEYGVESRVFSPVIFNKLATFAALLTHNFRYKHCVDSAVKFEDIDLLVNGNGSKYLEIKHKQARLDKIKMTDNHTIGIPVDVFNF